MDNTKSCPNCGSKTLYHSREVSAGGGYAPNYLPGLARAFAGLSRTSERFTLVVCADCGLTRFFARAEARALLADSKEWTRV